MAENTTTLHGIGVGSTMVVGPVSVKRPSPPLPANEPAPDNPVEAKDRAKAALLSVADSLRQAADETANETLSDVLQATSLIAADPGLATKTHALIDDGNGPATAIVGAVESFAEQFKDMGAQFAERITDLYSVRDRAVAILVGTPDTDFGHLAEPSVIVAVDLAPADTAALDLENVLGIVTEKGGPTSHTAIVAGNLGLPCIVQVPGATELSDGARVALDAVNGTVTINPNDDVEKHIAEYTQRRREMEQDTADGATRDGHPVELLVNVGTVAEAQRSKAGANQGSGLVRTEVLFLNAATEPSVESQANDYGDILTALAGKKAVVRTLDAGADKPLDFANLEDEDNPALGVRGFRLARTVPQLLANQLQALASAARNTADTGGQLWVMAPMISTAAEAAEFAAAARAAGISQVGVMIEVPGAALRAADILDQVDFVSLGTNDLAQYTMAADRLAGDLADLTGQWQPAVLQLVAATAAAGQVADKPVGVCGESAGDPLMALVLVGLGVTSLSMSPGSLAAVRYALRHHTMDECQAIAAAAMAAGNAPAARQAALELCDEETARMLGLTGAD